MAADQEREQPQTPTANNGRGRRLKGAKSTTNTSSTSPRKIAITKRRAKMLGFREQGYTYDQIARHFKVGTSTVCRDIFAAMDAIIQEPAQRLLKLELRRLDAMQSAHYANALDGDTAATLAVLRVMQHRAALLHSHDTSSHVHLNMGLLFVESHAAGTASLPSAGCL
jgi:hypothetical protein